MDPLAGSSLHCVFTLSYAPPGEHDFSFSECSGDEPLGETLGDNVRHMVVRVEFLNALLSDDRVRVHFQGWEEQTGLTAALQQGIPPREPSPQ
jgi:hypothetical protein